jgi:hypothetical protein
VRCAIERRILTVADDPDRIPVLVQRRQFLGEVDVDRKSAVRHWNQTHTALRRQHASGVALETPQGHARGEPALQALRGACEPTAWRCGRSHDPTPPSPK